MKKILLAGLLLSMFPVGAQASQTYAPLATTTPPGLSGLQLATNSNANYDALLSTNIGTAAPSYLEAGVLWADSTNNLLKYYDGSNWLSIGNFASHTWSPLGVGSGLTGIGTASLGGITGSPSSTTYLRGDGSWATPASGSGTITSSSSGQIPVYTASTTVAGGANFTISTGALTLGASGTAGSIKMGNATSGTITLQPATGALGTVTVSIPAATDTLVNLTGTQTLTNKTLTSPVLTTPALGTPASGVLSNTTGIGTSNMTAVTGSASSTTFLRGDNSWGTPAGAGTVTTTGSPASGNLAKFSGSTSITNTDLTGDVTTSGTLATNVGKINGTSLGGLATGILKNTTTTGVPSIATYADVVALFSSCSGTQYLGYDGNCHSATGSGTVTSVTFTGDGTILSSTPSSAVTTTGTLTAALANAGAGTVLGNATSSSAAPTYTATPQLGKSGTLGSVTMGNATSGLLTLEPVTGALGTVTVSIPAATDTLVNLTSAQTMTNKTLTSPALTTPTVTTSEVLTQTAIGTTSAAGFTLTNTTAATVGTQQFSPAIEMTGQGWKTNSTAASQTVNSLEDLEPVTGAANPSFNWVLKGQINAGGFTSLLTVPSGGGLNLNSGTYQINGTQIAASNLSNGTTGTGSIVLAASPTVSGTVVGASSTWSGTVGIGTATPVYNLDVNSGSTLIAGRIANSATDTLLYISNLTAGGHNWSIQSAGTGSGSPLGAGSLLFSDGSTSYYAPLSMNDTKSEFQGLVGIGTATPQQTLDVHGSAFVEGPLALTISGATFTPTFNTNNDFALTLVHGTCPCTLANPSGTISPGQHGLIYVIQSATGSDTVTTWGSQYLIAGGTAAITLSTAANAIDVFSYAVKDATHIVLSGPSLNVTH